MAHHTATLKSIRQTETRTAVNRDRKARIRTFVKKLEKAIEEGDKSAAQDLFKQTQSEILRGVTKGVLKANTAGRKISRLNTRVKNIAASNTKSKSEGKKAASKKPSKASSSK